MSCECVQITYFVRYGKIRVRIKETVVLFTEWTNDKNIQKKRWKLKVITHEYLFDSHGTKTEYEKKNETKNVLEHRMKSYKTAQQKYSLRRATEKTKTQESRQNHE